MARIIYGKRPVEEALRYQAGAMTSLTLDTDKRKPLASLAELAVAADIAISWSSRKSLDNLAGAPGHQGAVAELRDFDYTSVKAFLQKSPGTSRLVVALDSVTDPQNLGSCLRAAGAFGADLVVTTKRRCCPVTPIVVKVSAGGTEVVEIARENNLKQALKQLKDAGFWVYGLAADAQQTLAETDLAGDVVLVLGSEGEGLRHSTEQTCDTLIRIPANGPLESLNVAQACTIGLYEIVRQRSGA